MAKKSNKKSAPKKNRTREVLGILLIFIAVILLLSLVSHYPGDWPNSSRAFDEPYHNLIGWFGAILSSALLNGIGLTSYMLVAFIAVFGGVMFLHRSFLLLIKPGLFCGVLGLFIPLIAGLVADIGSGNTIAAPTFRFGGLMGGLLANFMITYLGKTGTFLLSLAAILVTVVLTTSLKLSTIAEWLWVHIKSLGTVFADAFHGGDSEDDLYEEPARKPRRKKASKSEPELDNGPGDDGSPFLTPLEGEGPDHASSVEPMIVDPRLMSRALEDEGDEADDGDGPEGDDEDGLGYEPVHVHDYVLPGPDLLDDLPEDEPTESREEMLDKAQAIVRSLRHFNIESEVRQITPGPIVTRYELTLAPGIKVNKVVGCSDNLAMTLKSRGGIRIQAPIPGKAAIGIEVPNNTRQTVYFRDIVESEAFRDSNQPLTIAIGKSTSGDPVVADLEKMPHLLIGGSTGSGKSVGINAIIGSLLMKATPDRMRMIMIDPKVVELNIYNAIPHLLTPVITDPGRAAEALKWAVREMEGRYRKLGALGVRDISQYNARVGSLAESAQEGDEPVPDPLPLIVIIIDEFADLMVVASNEIEESIARLAQMARAVGMHLVIATQRPSADVITGLIKANFPSRIAFKVMQASNSRIILDQAGADKLLGLGDMLFLQAGKPEPVRIHGAFISNEESQRIVDFVASQSEDGPVEVNEDMFSSEDEDEDNVLGLRNPGDRDALFFEAARLVVRQQQGSVSLLQRRLKIGYARAARLVDQLELAGIVSPYDGSKAREVLVDDEYLDEMEAHNL